MAIDEYIFGKIANYFSNRFNKSDEKLVHVANLSVLKQKLTILGRAFSGKPIEIFQAEREGGFKGNNFFLPKSISFFDTYEKNVSFYYFRLLYLCIQQELNINYAFNEDIDVIVAQENAIESAPIILNKLFDTYPICATLYNNLIFEYKSNAIYEKIDYSWFYGKWMSSFKTDELLLTHFTNKTKSTFSKSATLIQMEKGVEQIKTLEVDKKQQEDYVLTHNFEKVETADEHSGTWRDFDGDDELKNHQQALDELNINLVVRVDDTAHSIYQADFLENNNVSESTEVETNDFFYTYNEWNFSKQSYKIDYCKVYPSYQHKIDKLYYQKTIKDNFTSLQGLRKMLTSINNKMQHLKRQFDGDEFDLDALSDMFVDIISKKTPTENIFMAKRKKDKDLSIVLLLDLSLSSDSFDNGNRVLDVEKQVSILFGEILNEFYIDFSVQGFYSKTRNFTSFIIIKDFDEKWDIAKHKIGAVEPSGYTRIGAALRHAGFLLEKRQTQNKWLLLISDGKPNDYDKYEGRYGVQDVKKTLHELKSRNVNSFAFAIEAQAKYYLPQMFGQNHYQILTTPLELLKSLMTLYEKIKYA